MKKVLLSIIIICFALITNNVKGQTRVDSCCKGSKWGIRQYVDPPIVNVFTNFDCGSTITLKRRTLAKFKAVYGCAPGCTASIKYELRDDRTGSIVTISGLSPQTVASGATVSGMLSIAAGWYNLYIRALCNGSVCNTCIVKVHVIN